MKSKCVICGKSITRQFSLCSGCLKDFGNRKTWPDWLKFLVRCANRDLKGEHRRRMEVPLSGLPLSLMRETEARLYGAAVAGGEI